VTTAKIFLHNRYEIFAAEMNDVSHLYVNECCNQLSNPVAEYLTIYIQDCWSRFTRDVMLESAFKTSVNRRGTVFKRANNLAIRSSNTALDAIRRTWPNRSRPQAAYWEPSWYDIRHVAHVDRILGLRNRDIISGLEDALNPIEEVKMLRNFIAHRGHTSSPEMRELSNRLGLRSVKPLGIITAQHWDGGGRSVMENWLRNFNIVALAVTN
jgi:hypothetical protein